MANDLPSSYLVIVITRLHASKGGFNDEYDTEWRSPTELEKPDDAFLYEYPPHSLFVIHGHDGLVTASSKLQEKVRELLRDRNIATNRYGRVWLFVHGSKEGQKDYKNTDFSLLAESLGERFNMSRYTGMGGEGAGTRLVDQLKVSKGPIPHNVVDGVAKCLDPYPARRATVTQLQGLLLQLRLDFDSLTYSESSQEKAAITISLKEAVKDFDRLCERPFMVSLFGGRTAAILREEIDEQFERLWIGLASRESVDLEQTVTEERLRTIQTACMQLAKQLGFYVEIAEKRRA